jgi:XTP/dITP diphosphohydrolase
MKLCFATRNQHKIEEVASVLGADYTLLSLNDIGCKDELPETQNTIAGNSLQKAQYIWEHFGADCFADDSGLEVSILNGEPGVDSAHYAGTRDFDKNIQKLLTNLGNNTQREAQFKTVITLIRQGKVQQFEGIVKGQILFEKRGEHGFGYDPVFLPDGYEHTFGEMDLAQKNQISHRSRALQKLIEYLKNA